MMSVNAEEVLALEIPEKTFSLTARDTMLYALSIGFGQDPLDEDELGFVYEKNLRPVPTLAAVIGWDRSWIPATGLNWGLVVHGEEHLALHRPLPVSGAFTIRSRVANLIDKGKSKGAILQVETTALDGSTPVFTRTSSFFARGDGGFSDGSSPPSATPVRAIPARAPDMRVTVTTTPVSALLYRLTGDRNPLHCDPAVARAAGFPRPILHGLCSYGHAARAVLRSICGYDAGRISSFDVRFSSPVFPGETLEILLWQEIGGAFFEAYVKERDVKVLTNGYAGLR